MILFSLGGDVLIPVVILWICDVIQPPTMCHMPKSEDNVVAGARRTVPFEASVPPESRFVICFSHIWPTALVFWSDAGSAFGTTHSLVSPTLKPGNRSFLQGGAKLSHYKWDTSVFLTGLFVDWNLWGLPNKNPFLKDLP